jgi:galactokinase
MIAQFEELYGGSLKPRIFRAPGRVNLIGEHTDYNLGFVMPIALDMACYMASAAVKSGKIQVYSLDRGEGFDFDLDVLRAKPRKNWTDYVIGVAQKLAQRGVHIYPMKLMLHSEVPEGSGLSSSAALEVSSALAFLGGRSFDKVETAKLCQQAEIEFVGMPCGIMDQYVSVFGQDQRAIEIDCRSLEYRAVELPKDAVIIAVNSMVKHELASSAYSERVRECAEAVEGIQKKHPEVKALRDAKLEFLDGAGLSEVVARRARHIITEDTRVEKFRDVAAKGDLVEMGKLFVASHYSMKDDYEITCEEVDFLVDEALKIDGVFGARMTGGGFGGCTVNLVRPDAVNTFQSEIVKRYQDKYKVTAPVFRCNPSKGAMELGEKDRVPDAPGLKN